MSSPSPWKLKTPDYFQVQEEKASPLLGHPAPGISLAVSHSTFPFSPHVFPIPRVKYSGSRQLKNLALGHTDGM